MPSPRTLSATKLLHPRPLSDRVAAVMDFSRLQHFELLGIAASALLLVSIFLPWYSLTDPIQNGHHLRDVQNSWVCGVHNFSCSGWETHSIIRILLILAAAAPLILSYLIVSNQDERAQYPTGEFTMTVGMAVIVLVGFNGLISKPGSTPSFGVSLDIGYWLALLAGLLMATAGALRSLESGGGAQRKPPATF